MVLRLSAPHEYRSLLDGYDTWMFDCDGVLWHGDRLIDGAVQFLQLLRKKSASTPLPSDLYIVMGYGYVR